MKKSIGLIAVLICASLSQFAFGYAEPTNPQLQQYANQLASNVYAGEQLMWMPGSNGNPAFLAKDLTYGTCTLVTVSFDPGTNDIQDSNVPADCGPFNEVQPH